MKRLANSIVSVARGRGPLLVLRALGAFGRVRSMSYGSRRPGSGGSSGGSAGVALGDRGSDVTESAERRFVQAVLAPPMDHDAVLDDSGSLRDAFLQSGDEPPLLSCEAMEVVQLPTQLFVDVPFTVVLRKHTLDIADEAVKHLRLPDGWAESKSMGPAVLVTGSPGIGKTEAFTIALLRSLLRGDASPAPPVVVIENRTWKVYVKLKFNIVGGRAVSVQSARTFDESEYSEAMDPDLKTASAVFIMDPTSVGGKVGSPANISARTVVIASPNSNHFKDFKKRRPGPLTLYMRHWSLAELLVARPYMSPATDAATTVTRWVKLGGIPRFAFGTALELDEAVARTLTRTTTLPLEVVKVLYRNPDVATLVESGENALTYVESEPPFTGPKMGFLSKWVEREVWRTLRVSLMSVILWAQGCERAKHGILFEKLALIVIGEGGKPRVAYLPSECDADFHWQEWELAQAKERADARAQQRETTGMRSPETLSARWPDCSDAEVFISPNSGKKTTVYTCIRYFEEIEKEAQYCWSLTEALMKHKFKGGPPYMLRFVNSDQETVDAIGPGKVAYQVTVSASHGVNVDGLKQAIDLVGATREDPLRLCFLVPQNVFPAWLGRRDVIPSDHLPEGYRGKARAYVVRMTENLRAEQGEWPFKKE